MTITPEFYKQMRDLAAKYEIKIITPVQHPRPPGHRPYPMPETDIVVIDYIDLLPRHL